MQIIAKTSIKKQEFSTEMLINIINRSLFSSKATKKNKKNYLLGYKKISIADKSDLLYKLNTNAMIIDTAIKNGYRSQSKLNLGTNDYKITPILRLDVDGIDGIAGEPKTYKYLSKVKQKLDDAGVCYIFKPSTSMKHYKGHFLVPIIIGNDENKIINNKNAYTATMLQIIKELHIKHKWIDMTLINTTLQLMVGAGLGKNNNEIDSIIAKSYIVDKPILQIERIVVPEPRPKPSFDSKTTPHKSIDPKKLKYALKHVKKELRYNEWFSIGLAIHTELGDSGYKIFNKWSKNNNPDSYDKSSVENKWAEICKTNQHVKTFGTIIHYMSKKGRNTYYAKYSKHDSYSEMERLMPKDDIDLEIVKPKKKISAGISKEIKEKLKAKVTQYLLKIGLNPKADKVNKLASKIVSAVVLIDEEMYTGQILKELKNAGNVDMPTINTIMKLEKQKITKDRLELEAKSSGYPDYIVTPIGGVVYLSTQANLVAMLKKCGYKYYFDVIKKQPYLKQKIEGKWIKFISDDIWSNKGLNSAISLIMSDGERENLPADIVDKHLMTVLKDNNRINPFWNIVTEHEWDNKDRFDELAKRVTGSTNSYASAILKKFFIQMVAGATYAKKSPIKNAKSKFEQVLVLHGLQGIGKTQFFMNLFSADKRMKKYFGTGNINIALKDDVKTFSGYLLFEWGEIDATFKKSDISTLKGFLSKEYDELRLPYDRTNTIFPRTTTACGSVNNQEFLKDATGNRRYMTIESLAEINLSNLDIMQLWYQAVELYTSGSHWWLDSNLDKGLIEAQNAVNEKFTDNGVAGDIVDELLKDIKEIEKTTKKFRLSPTIIYKHYKNYSPTNMERSSFIEQLHKKGMKIDKTGVSLPEKLANRIKNNLYSGF